MAADPKLVPTSSSALVEVLNQLACPACFGNLRIEEGDLICVLCGRSFPIVDGIPVLIAEQAGQEHSGQL